MRRVTETLLQYGQPSTQVPLEWSWVDQQLRTAGIYWVSVQADQHPHPRPVWGVWIDDVLHFTIGTPKVVAAPLGTPVTVHLESGTDVVIVEGVIEARAVDPAVVAAYDTKYTWSYDVDAYGPLTSVRPIAVLAWRAAGAHGRDGFTTTGRWRWTS